MSYQEAIVGYLSTPENLKLALEIAEQVETVKASLVESFWNNCFDNLQKQWDNPSVFSGTDHWELYPSSKDMRGKLGISFYPKTRKVGQTFFIVGLHNDGRLFEDITLRKQGEPQYWGSYEKISNEIPEIVELRNKLSEYRFTTPKSKIGNLAYKYFEDFSFLDKQSLLKLIDPVYSEQISNEIWKLFHENREILEHINSQIIKMEEQDKMI